MKSVFRFASLLLAVTILSAAVSSVSFIVTKKLLDKAEAPSQAEAQSLPEASYAAKADLSQPSRKFDFYTVRLEGESLNIYASHNGDEEFLYNTEIFKSDLSAEDTLLLTSGVSLESSAALTEFIENFTS